MTEAQELAAEPEGTSGDPINDVLTAWVVALLLGWAGWQAAPDGFGAYAAAAAWAVVPIALAATGRFRWAELGLLPRRPLRSLLWLAGVSLAVLPLFAVAVVWWEARRGNGAWSVPPATGLLALLGPQLLLAGFPEELFFRGYAQRRLGAYFGGAEQASPGSGSLPSRARWKAIVATSALFGLSHVVFLANPLSLAGLARFTTFFPGLLFGLLRERTDDVWAPALFHALCNAWLFWLYTGFA